MGETPAGAGPLLVGVIRPPPPRLLLGGGGVVGSQVQVVGRPQPGSRPGKIGVCSVSKYVCGQKYDVTDNFSAARCARTALFWSRPPAATTFPAILEHFWPEFMGNHENHGFPWFSWFFMFFMVFMDFQGFHGFVTVLET